MHNISIGCNMNREETITYPANDKKGRSRHVNEQIDDESFSGNEVKQLISQLLWDREEDVMFYLELLRKEKRTPAEEKQLQALYIKILNYNSWHKIVKYFGLAFAVEEMLTDNVIRGLFPRPLRKKYEFVRNVLSKAV